MSCLLVRDSAKVPIEELVAVRNIPSDAERLSELGPG